jgi:hypothetical protein
MSQTEATRQFDWIMPTMVDNTATPNSVALAVTFAAGIVDLSTLPGIVNTVDRSENALEPNPLGHYITLEAQTADVFFQFGPSFAAFTPNQVTAVTLPAGNVGTGSGYTVVPTVGFTPTSGGSGAAATAVLNVTGGVQSIVMTNPGGGYVTAPTVTFTNGTGGSGLGAAGTAVLGVAPLATQTTTVNSSTGAVTSVKGTCGWLPMGVTLDVKLPVGSPNAGPWGASSPCRYLAYVTGGSGTTATLRIWQSSP